MLQQVRELEEQIAKLKALDAEKQRYELKELKREDGVFAEGIFVYALKADAELPEPPHRLCANCYHNGQKSVLQKEDRNPGRAEVLICHRCGAENYVAGGWQPEHSGRRRTPR